MAELADIIFDCRHPASLARFWAAVLDGYDIAPYDDEELERLADSGITGPEDDPTVLVEPSDDGRPRIWFQQVPEPKAVKNRLHLDVRTVDLASEVQRLSELGAEVFMQEPGGDFVVMTDPEGNEFCVLS